MTATLEHSVPYANGISERPTSVVKAIAKVMGALPAIGKDGKADPAQGGYRYRGIEQITAVAQRLMAEHGVIFVPRVVKVEIVDLTVNNKPWTDTRLTVEYSVFGPDGDHIVVGPVLAIGRDNSDKGANKAMTQAYKQALLQVFCISDSKDDTDGSTHEADERRPGARHASAPEDELPWRELGYTDPGHFTAVNDALRAQFHNLPEDRVAAVKAWLKDQGYDRPVPVRAEHADPYRRLMDGQPVERTTAAPKPPKAKEKLVHELRQAVEAIPPSRRRDLADALKTAFGYEKADEYDMTSARAAIAMVKEWEKRNAPKPTGKPMAPQIAAAVAYAEAEGVSAEHLAVLAAHVNAGQPIALSSLGDDEAAEFEALIGDLVSGAIVIQGSSVVAS